MTQKIIIFIGAFLFSITLSAQVIVNVATDGSGDYNCDGVNDEIEINQALDFVSTQGGGTVHLKEGTYVVDGQMRIHSNTMFEGVDSSSTIIRIKDWSSIEKLKSFIINYNFDNYGGVIIDSNIFLQNFAFDGNRINNEDDDHWPGDSWHTAVAFMGVKKIDCNSVRVYNNLNDAFQFQYCDSTTVANCSTTNIGHDAIYYIYSYNLIAENNTFDLAADAGVRTDNSNHILIRNNYIFDKDGYGGCAIEIAYRGQITVMDDLVIENNLIEQAPMAGITLYSDNPETTNGTIIRNNVIFQVGTSGGTLPESAGINITNFDNVIIENNTIYNCVGSGIRFGSEWYYENSDKPRTAVISNNIITSSTGYDNEIVYGIEILDITSVSCNNNNVWNNKSGDYYNCDKGDGDISQDPLFVNAPYNDGSGNNPYYDNVDLHLQSSSPCINTGVTISSIFQDFDGISRPQGDAYDIGAYEFPIKDVTSPTITSTIPESGAVDAATDATVSITFSEPMNKNTVSISGIEVSGTSWNGNTITLTHDIFEQGKTYTVIVNGEDVAGNTLDEYSFSFTTESKNETGISESNSFLLTVYPNPVTDGEVFFLIPDNEKVKAIVFYNSLGVEVKRVPVNDSKEAISIQDLEQGVYVVKILFRTYSKSIKMIIE